ncbi:N-acetylmuramoyl-L-alanine amidase [Saccharibacillus sp. CPCC 101409]|uniref:peptidoglycan recognition protein family protein n=1 Tax=Saccharibacillus sp. CPCC 101409 TaxID=3058041 RepID=UPI002672CBD0|nr:N-acetylmuramoyl-L-alanine amidase [Saccharibacillus sp. CPCC 101409]MDO3408562.1 N-acetylmuramoyl-L-alanine amidase [Saccharibacillus sp. CPCC 101409]
MNLTQYPIERRYIAKRSNTRPGLRLTTGAPAFFVAHDTGNPGAGADSHFKYFNALTDRSASAHTFIDDKKILEIVPAGTGSDPAEKAWHVIYNVTTDNERFGYNANDAALGVELCYGGGIDFEQAYKRFVWYLAYCCGKWNKDPRLFIPSHKQLDPARKIDCDNALKAGGRTLKDLIADVASELNAAATVPNAEAKLPASGSAPASGGRNAAGTVGAGAPSAPAQTDFTPLPADMALALVSEYVRPAWAQARAAGKQPEAEHFHRLAVNLRSAAGIDDAGQKLPAAVKLHKSNVQELVFRWLSPAWYKAKADGDSSAAASAHERANRLRLAAGLPQE